MFYLFKLKYPLTISGYLYASREASAHYRYVNGLTSEALTSCAARDLSVGAWQRS
jgi:hypothetical protein